MGLIIPKQLRRKFHINSLENINKEMKSIEDSLRTRRNMPKKIMRYYAQSTFSISVISSLIYPILYPFNAKIFLSFVVFAVLYFPLSTIVSKCNKQAITKRKVKLSKLQMKKEEIVNKIMHTETYDDAQLLLEENAPEMFRNNTYSSREKVPMIPHSCTILNIAD
ncbi:PREDICTED: uncharacterized protein LOC108556526 [Nicrophorus vespilloides]|uniref:Uncharacterized protein LOC108556526 n=1 Tax=Nicrophorus vespilloides TaxID=110193 RepID=A0ABM1M0R6_NICVS|nr:PREDICTED: uncharacterized protein LOC108556526 [Nicrophorus vespilloides]XP_017768167.1 PREDICTED: uncharacterized protein LOC108556526 [Nicrophorus vespilloides]